MKLFSVYTKLERYLTNSDYRFMVNAQNFGYFCHMDDKTYLEKMYKARIGKELRLDHPVTFNEKLQWLKLYDRKSEYISMVDKYEMKQFVAGIIGQKYIIPTIGIWNHFEDIDFSLLPDKFVLKCTHDSGGVVICKNKQQFNIITAKKKIEKSLKRNYYWIGREWPYKFVRPRIIAEEYLSDSDNQLTDYKVHCFHGSPKIILVCKDRFSGTGINEDFFTIDWKHISVCRPGIENSKKQIGIPEKLSELLSLSEKLSQDIPFLRCDFYIVNDKIYLGELTFFPASGFKPFLPESFDLELGSYLNIL